MYCPITPAIGTRSLYGRCYSIYNTHTHDIVHVYSTCRLRVLDYMYIVHMTLLQSPAIILPYITIVL